MNNDRLDREYYSPPSFQSSSRSINMLGEINHSTSWNSNQHNNNNNDNIDDYDLSMAWSENSTAKKKQLKDDKIVGISRTFSSSAPDAAAQSLHDVSPLDAPEGSASTGAANPPPTGRRGPCTARSVAKALLLLVALVGILIATGVIPITGKNNNSGMFGRNSQQAGVGNNSNEIPSSSPTATPSAAPSTGAPSLEPSERPSSIPSFHPSSFPTLVHSNTPTQEPSTSPSSHPSSTPSQSPSSSSRPSAAPTSIPSAKPTSFPTVMHSKGPTQGPSAAPTGHPSISPTTPPTVQPSSIPTGSPSHGPTHRPSVSPSYGPTHHPSISPTRRPTTTPSFRPTTHPTKSPTPKPTGTPTLRPTPKPTLSPTPKPTGTPTFRPTPTPTASPTPKPTSQPTRHPTPSPTVLTAPLFVPVNPVPTNPPPGYFNYDDSTPYGPNNWHRVDTSNHWLKEFTPSGWGPWQGHFDEDLTRNLCAGPDRKQSPKNLYETFACEAHHELRTQCATHALSDDTAFDKRILPHKLSIVSKRRPCLAAEKDGRGIGECDGDRPPMVDYPKYASAGSAYSDMHHFDIKVPGEHTLQGETFDAEIQLFHTHLTIGRLSSIAVPIRASSEGYNENFQWVLDEFQYEYDLHAHECNNRRRQLSNKNNNNTTSSVPPPVRRNLDADLRFDPYADAFLPTMFFYRYDGSITEPPCKDITWWVMDQPTFISTAQLQQLRRILLTHVDSDCTPTSVHNEQQAVVRPIQPLGDNRVIEHCHQGDFISDIAKGRNPAKQCRN